MPPPWVWSIFTLSIGIFAASMLTWREGRRFVSRPLLPQEARIVMAALNLWQSTPDPPDGLARLRAMAAEGKLLAMSSLTFERAEERATFGYTDERGRILINPNLCFANQRMCEPDRPDVTDVVATLCTLYHESRHLMYQTNEAQAYELEWGFVRRTTSWARQNQPTLARELTHWDEEMPMRIRLYVGDTMVEKIRAKVDDDLELSLRP